MKRLFSTIVMAAFAVCAFGGPVDGKWHFEMKGGGKKRGERQIASVLDLKTNGNALTGQLSASAGKRARTADVVDGKVDGNNVSFTTVQKSKKGETKLLWSGVLEGDQLKLTRKREGGKRGTEVTAKRQ